MKQYKWLLILLNALALLGYFNYSLVQKEALLAEGKLVLLHLAPVDPRSLMQGDYMRLSYEIASDVQTDSISKRGYCIVTLDSVGVAHRVRLQPALTPLSEGEYPIVYTTNGWTLNIGAESYFFQEGQSEKYAKALYGAIRTDKEGHSVLVGLYDEARKRIE